MSKLYDIRTKKDMTQYELAEAVKVDRSWISKIETGQDSVPEWLAKRIADALETTTRRLFIIEPERHKRYRVKK